MSVKNVASWVRELLSDWLPGRGYELWNVEFVKSGHDRNLNVYIDRLPEPSCGGGASASPGTADDGGAQKNRPLVQKNRPLVQTAGIGTDDCELVSRYLSERLDAEDVIDGNYYLVVSSPGMDRPLLTDEHFARYRGVPVDVSLYRGVDGRKTYSGILGQRTDESLTIIGDDGREAVLPRELVSKVRLQVIF